MNTTIFRAGTVALLLIGGTTLPAIAETKPAAAAAATTDANQVSPLSEVKKTVDSVVEAAERYRDNTKERRAKLREIINPRFDFVEMAKRSLGAEWNQVNAQQQKDYTDTFSELLARTYLSKIETVKPGMVTIDSERKDFPLASVRTSVTSKGDVFPIEYRLQFKDNSWKVYDVIIENIGLVANYRNEFAGIIRSRGFDGLMTLLREKNAKAEAKA